MNGTKGEIILWMEYLFNRKSYYCFYWNTNLYIYLQNIYTENVKKMILLIKKYYLLIEHQLLFFNLYTVESLNDTILFYKMELYL